MLNIMLISSYQVVNEMASAAGLSCVVDPVLVTALKVQRTGNFINCLVSNYVITIIFYFSF
jgi:hypothetical protein